MKYKDIKRLYVICNDCNREVYLSEIFSPFLSMCCPEEMKVVPVFDDKNVGKITENESVNQKRMKTIYAVKKNGKYIVPDFIFVPLNYSFANPIKPYLMVETKLPIFPVYKMANIGNYYCPLENIILKKSSELLPEINACNNVIFIGGITWMFLEHKNNKIIENSTYKTIKFVNQHEYHNKKDTCVRITEKHNQENIETELNEWIQLQTRIKKCLQIYTLNIQKIKNNIDIL